MQTDSFRRMDVLINRSESFRWRRSTSLAVCLSACRVRMYISCQREYNDVVIVALIADHRALWSRAIPYNDFSPIKWMTVKLVRSRARRYTIAYTFDSLIWYLAFDLPARIGDATVKRYRNCRYWNGTCHSGQQPNYLATKSYPRSSIKHEKQMYIY